MRIEHLVMTSLVGAVLLASFFAAAVLTGLEVSLGLAAVVSIAVAGLFGVLSARFGSVRGRLE